MDATTTTNGKPFGHTKLPNHLFRTELSASAIATAASILWHAGSRDVCWPSQETIGKDIGLGRNAVSRAVKELETVGLRTFYQCRYDGRPIMHYDVSGLRDSGVSE